MSSLNEIREERIKKLNILKEKGINPYPSTTSRTHTVRQVLCEWNVFTKFLRKPVILAGRVIVRRGQGAILFVDFKDGTGQFQAVLKEDDMDSKSFKLFIDTVDGGDFVEFSGILFITKKGQKSIRVNDWKMLSKSLLPLPDKHHGLKNEEERFRKRYLDLLGNEDLKEMFRMKEKFWDVTRTFMKSKGFMEVETPTLEITTGGAEARPFKTYHNDFDMDVYLRISVGELWQKHLMASGIPKTFEIGRVYRNEGTSPEHLQEFTNMEFYWAYANYKDGMKLVKSLYLEIANKVFGTTKFEVHGHKFDFSDEWIEVDYLEEIKKQTGVDIITASEDDMKKKLNELKVTYDGDSRERLTDTLWKYCRKNISGPAFLVNHPKLVAPLAKAREDGKTVEMFQPIIAGSEVGRGYSELNDPIDQKARFEVQQKLLEAGDDEAMMPDWEFVEMLEHGIPPTCGFGFGERLFATLVGKPIRETQLFPLMRPKD